MRAVNLSGVVGCICFVAFFSLRAPAGHMAGSLALLLYGIPVGLVLAWMFVAPMLAVLMRRPVSRLRAMACGAGFAVIVAAAVMAMGYTGRSWWINVSNSAALVVGTVFVALIVREVVGPGHDV